MFCSQVQKAGVLPPDSKLKENVLDYKEAGQKFLAFDRLGYGHEELNTLIESGVQDEKRKHFFTKISKVKKHDHAVLKDIKHKIKHLIDLELD